MAKKTFRRLVIDTSIASAAGGEDATFPTSKYCRDFLKAVLDICHRVVMNPDIRDEWKRHESGFARRWLVSMYSRKKVERPDRVQDNELREKVQSAARSERESDAILKDIHLIEAALATDKAVASLDDNARELFRDITEKMGKLKPVIWVNPSNEPEDVIAWLKKKGAKFEKRRSLGHGTDL